MQTIIKSIQRKWRRIASLSACALAYTLSSHVVAQELSEIDYSDPKTWLCSPENNAACEVDLTTTSVAADGSLTRESFMASKDAPVDCFYVYPTVSLDQSALSDMNPGPEELNVVKSQFARYGSQCRLFAPMYRQFTLSALRGEIQGGLDRTRGPKDVLNAWNYYLENFNEGRGVLLVGHSQGTMVLTSMIAAHIDGKSVEEQIIAAHLIGAPVQVPDGEVVGATFKSMPLCEKAEQSGCIINYSAYRDTVPPGATAMFGRGGESTLSACTNPAQILRGSTSLNGHMSNPVQDASAPSVWVNNGAVIDTPFVALPGLITGDCVTRGRYSYIEVTVNADPADPRADIIPGDVMTPNGPSDSWGLHLVDMHILMADLVGLAGTQSKAWLAK